MQRHARQRRVQSTGLALNVREYGAAEAGAPHVVMVHGFPDQQDMWDLVVRALDPHHFHVVTYDVRGAGGSDVPPAQEGYRTELLVEDLVAVVQATVPEGEPFHLVGHDWGSVQLWDVVKAENTDPRLSGRIASFTSISGPSLDHMAHLYRHGRGRLGRLLNQSVHSWYVYAFHVPVLPEMIWTRQNRVVSKVMSALDRRGKHSHWGPELGRNAANGLNLYRANIRRRMLSPGRTRTDVPVLVVVPTKDKFLTRVTVEDLDQHCSDLRVVEVDAGHWVTRSHPDRIAGLVADHVQAHAR